MSTDFIYDFQPLYVPRVAASNSSGPAGHLDNPHTCILDDTVRCLCCAINEALGGGDETRLLALDLAAAIAEGGTLADQAKHFDRTGYADDLPQEATT